MNRLLSVKHDLEVIDNYGRTALHYLAVDTYNRSAVTTMIDAILQKGALVDAQVTYGGSNNGNTALYYAVDHVSDLAKVQLLTATWCADVELKGGNAQQTPLQRAAVKHLYAPTQPAMVTAAYDVLDQLLQMGADVDAQDGSHNKRTALMYQAGMLAGRTSTESMTAAYQAEWKKRMLRLLQHAVNLDVKNGDGEALLYILSEDHLKRQAVRDVMAQVLLQGADVDIRKGSGGNGGYNGRTALGAAADNNDLLTATLLATTWCADVDLGYGGSNTQHSPLFRAGMLPLDDTTAYDMIDYLLTRGADVEDTNGNAFKNRTPLIDMAYRFAATHPNGRQNAADTAEWKKRMLRMLDVLHNLDHQDVHGHTILHTLAYDQYPERAAVNDVMTRVLERGIDVDIQNHLGETALYDTAQYAGLSHLELLLDWCADKSLAGGNYNPKKTPLERAEMLENPNTPQYVPIIAALQ
jgi:ankyrin repeat protein